MIPNGDRATAAAPFLHANPFLSPDAVRRFFLPFSPFAERFAGSRGTARSVRKIPNVFPNRFLQV